MSKNLKSLAEKYSSFTELERIDIEAAARGEVTNAWFSNRPNAIDTLIDLQWFHLEKLGLEVGNDERLRIGEGVIGKIPEEENRKKLEYARDFIADYFSLATKYISDPSKVGQKRSIKDSSDGWGEEEFLLGLLGPDRGGDSGLFD